MNQAAEGRERSEKSEDKLNETTEDPKQNQLQAEKVKLEEQVKELDDKYKRSLAENENIRNRLMRQIEDAKQFGIQGFCKDLLEVADILGKATESVPAEELKKNVHLKNLYEGLTMTDSQLHKVFTRHGLKQINPLGEKFNPNLHEALFEEPNADKEVGTVSMVTKIGYKLHERTIRPALVGVVKAPT
jgi:molecular chaperone GrpE